MKIKFPRNVVVDTDNIPQDFEEQIRASFKAYTEGTAEAYTYQDKLAYIDTWSHLVWANPEHVTDWREDGIEVDEVIAIIPEAIQHMGLTRPWCWLQRVGLIPLE